MPTSSFSSLGLPLVSGGYPGALETRERSWSNTANYGSVAKADLPINTYIDARRWISQVPVYWRDFRPSNNQTVNEGTAAYSGGLGLSNRHNEMSSFLAEVETPDATLLNSVVIKALGKVADQKVNVAVAFAEASKTANLVLSSANRIYSAYRAFRKGQLGIVARELAISPKKVHTNWLEYKYGWMPLLMDVKGSAELLAQHHFGRPIHFTVSASERVDMARTVKEDASWFSPGSYSINSASGSKVYKVKLWCVISNPHLSVLQQMGLTNPALVAWELVPFSFVFDWFMSIGDYLKGLTALHGISLSRSMASRIREFTGTYDSVALPYLQEIDLYKTGYRFHFQCKGRGYSRQALVINALDLFPPVNETPFNVERLITGLALLRAQSSRYR